MKVVRVTAMALLLGGCSTWGAPRGSPPPAFAPPGGLSGMGPMGLSREAALRRFDADADTKITRAEFDAVLASDYSSADTDGDRVLGGTELRALNDKLARDPNISPILDWNGDGQVSIEEFGAQWRSMFLRADQNEDGVVTQDEMLRPAPMPKAPRMPAGGPPGGMPPGGPPGGRPPGGGRPGG